MNLETAVAVLKQELRDHPEKLELEKNTLEKFGKLFAYDNIDNIDKEQFEDFCDLKNNHHWTISRHKTNLTQDMQKLRKSLKILLDESIPVANRLKRLRDEKSPDYQKYLGEAYFSPILLVAHPDKYPVYNGTVKDALDKIQVTKITSRDIWERYPEVQKIILGIAHNYGLSLWQMDWVWWKALGAKSYEELLTFVNTTMEMKENYQPIVLRKILNSESATRKEIEEELKKFNPDSESKSMIDTVLKVLQDEKHAVIRKQDDKYVINSFDELSSDKIKELVRQCNKKLDEFQGNVKPNHWVWSVTPENWEIVKEKNIWASKIGQNIRDRIRPGDKVIFYVQGTNEFQGVFEFVEEWYDAKNPVWSDEVDSVIYQSQIKLNPIKMGSVRVYDVAPKLKMFSKPGDKRLINLVLKGGGGYPSNNGKPIVYEDYLRLIELMDESVTDAFLSEQDFKKMIDCIPLVVEYNKSQLTNSDHRLPNPDDIQLCAKLQYYCALRISELLKLTPSKINLQNNEINIDERSNDAAFDIATIPPSIKNDLNKYLKDMPHDKILFPFTRQLLWSYYKKAGKLAELNLFKEQNERTIEGMSTSILRESRGMHMLKKGASEGLIRLKLRIKNKDDIFKSVRPTIQELKDWELAEYENTLTSVENNVDKNSKTFGNTNLSFPKDSLDETKKEIQKELLIRDETIEQIVASLYAGKNVLLTGPVGTGKTHLAQLIPKLIWSDVGGYYPETVTATSDWTTQDVVGGIFPKVNGTDISYIVQKGCVADTVARNWENGTSNSEKRVTFTIGGNTYNGVWLVIDEFNRANIDRAFGQLFTALEYDELKIPTTNPEKIYEMLKIPKDYRIIGTLNTFDKHHLFKISDALKRRFSFIEILPPEYKYKQEEKKFVVEKAIDGFDCVQNELNIHSFQDVLDDKDLVLVLDNLYEIMAFIRMSKNLGTALLISIFRLVLINYLTTKDLDKSLDSALNTSLLPQMESLHYWQLDSIMNFVGGRIQEMFRKYDVNKKPDVDRYEDELKNLTKYLTISGTNKNAMNWNSKFRTGEIMSQTNLDDLNPWKDKIKPKLKEFRMGLDSLKREKGYFDDEGESLEYEE